MKLKTVGLIFSIIEGHVHTTALERKAFEQLEKSIKVSIHRTHQLHYFYISPLMTMNWELPVLAKD